MPHAEEVLLAADRFKHAASDKEQVEGYVRLGVAEIVALTWLPRLIRFVRQSYPRLQLELEVALSHLIEEKLYAGTLDVAFAACEMSKSHFTSAPIEAVRFAWMCSPKMTTVPEVLTPQRLSELPVIATSREWQFRGSTLTWLTANDVHFRNLTICNTFRTAASLAMSGLGFAYLPEQHFRAELEASSLRRLRFDPDPSPLQIYAIRPLSDAIDAHLLLEKAAETAIAAEAHEA